MTGIKIYSCSANCTSTSPTYSLIYTADNCENINITKSSGVMPFSLPIVNSTQETSTRMVTEKSDLIKISGVETVLDISFSIHVSEIKTLLDLITNRIDTKHKIVIDDWSTDLNSIVDFIGIIGNMRLRQTGGAGDIDCTITFYEGDNFFANMDL